MKHPLKRRYLAATTGLLLLPGLLASTPGSLKPDQAKPPRYTFKELLWSDEFNYTGLPDSVKWTYDVGGTGWGNNELQLYTKARRENARVEKGHLVIEARKEALNEKNPYTSTRLVSRAKGGGSLTYGRVEVRAQLPSARGIWPAIWMLPDEWKYGDKSWPANGEIDIMEYVGYRPAIVQASTHCKKYYFRTNNQKTDSISVPTATTAYHVYAMEWTPETISVFVDSKLYFTSRNEHTGWEAWPWDHPFHLLLNVAVGGDWGGKKGIDEAAFPQQMLVDYVRFYKMKQQ
ncbi:glycoside hydrolase family 16 protein [Microvirga sp. STR05]|uniref:Glycoside hydrolase family 16 protein n=1 Tax=Hymenobacter duratus TaxID=2771356 RepID=A0ABR8JKW9_9BACT|nr:glycoside hydrolase family 16 protein [Hymenobacter duratus]MBD2716368.1 glycoside hydrolase family 16 protein [Hymenobacter duratus]MBR7951283.1 glycoside hydrolase family 16 protein [Microvirga sp. STR05]